MALDGGTCVLLFLCVSNLLATGCSKASQESAQVASTKKASAVVPQSEALGIRWAASFTAAQKEARKSGKPIFVAFNTTELGNPHSPDL